jgi:hypothetical protein
VILFDSRGCYGDIFLRRVIKDRLYCRMVSQCILSWYFVLFGSELAICIVLMIVGYFTSFCAWNGLCDCFILISFT